MAQVSRPKQQGHAYDQRPVDRKGQSCDRWCRLAATIAYTGRAIQHRGGRMISQPITLYAPLVVMRARPIASAPWQRIEPRTGSSSSQQTAASTSWRVNPNASSSNTCHGSTRTRAGNWALDHRAQRVQNPHSPS